MTGNNGAQVGMVKTELCRLVQKKKSFPKRATQATYGLILLKITTASLLVLQEGARSLPWARPEEQEGQEHHKRKVLVNKWNCEVMSRFWDPC